MNPVGRRIAEYVEKLGGSASFNKLVEKGLVPPEIERGASLLEQEGLAKITREKKQQIILSERGKNAAKNGLPEKQLFILIKDAPKPLSQLQSSLGHDIFASGLGVLKKIGSVKIENNHLLLISKPDLTLESSLKLVEDGKIPNEKEAALLKE